MTGCTFLHLKVKSRKNEVPGSSVFEVKQQDAASTGIALPPVWQDGASDAPSR